MKILQLSLRCKNNSGISYCFLPEERYIDILIKKDNIISLGNLNIDEDFDPEKICYFKEEIIYLIGDNWDKYIPIKIPNVFPVFSCFDFKLDQRIKKIDPIKYYSLNILSEEDQLYVDTIIKDNIILRN